MIPALKDQRNLSGRFFATLNCEAHYELVTQWFLFEPSPGAVTQENPTLRLHFHPIADKDRILKVIKEMSIRSDMIPIYYAESADYIVVTSPGWINGGYHSDDAQKLVAPVDEAIKKQLNAAK